MELLFDIEIERQKVEDLRVRIYDYIATNCSKNISVDDVRKRIEPPEKRAPSSSEDCKTSDLMLRRLLICTKPAHNVDEALKLFVETFKWRAQHNLPELKIERVIPLEFFHVNPFLVDGYDRKGNKLFIVRVKFYRKMPEFDVLIKNGLLYMLEQYDLEFEQGKFQAATMVMDLQDFDYWANYNFDLLRFAVQSFFKYRGLTHSVLVYKFPYVLGYLLTLVESWIAAVRGFHHKMIHLVDDENIDQYIEADQRPHFLNGTRLISQEVPENVVPFSEMIKCLVNDNVVQHKNAQRMSDYIDELMTQIGD